MFEEDPMLITQPSWPAASPSLVTSSKSHHCRVLSTTATTVAFSQPPQPLSRFVNHCHLRHVLSTTAIIVVAPSTVRFSILFFSFFNHFFYFFVIIEWFKILFFNLFILYSHKLKFSIGQYRKMYFIMAIYYGVTHIMKIIWASGIINKYFSTEKAQTK